MFLIASGLLHAPLYLVSSVEWEAAASWRKPILFGISTGLTLASVAWVSSLCVKATPTLLVLFSLSAVIEVALITIQTWRGEASHYNYSTPLNEVIQTSIETCALFLTAGIFVYSTKLIISPASNSKTYLLAARAGMLYLLAACFFGIWMVVYGAQRVTEGHPPGLYGEAGVLKFVHGLPIHAIQFFPVYVWLCMRMHMEENKIQKHVCFLITGVGLLTLYGSLQTFQGLSRFGFSFHNAPVLILALVLLAIPFVAFVKKDPAAR